MVCERQEYKYKDFTYILDENRRYIIEKEGEPQNVYKYYGMNFFSIDALMKGYLYATCPFNFNDIMDSSEYLLDFSKITFERYKYFFEQMLRQEQAEFEKHNWNDIYEKDRKENFSDLRKCFYAFQTYQFGTISLTKNPFNILMWGHYAGETGFSIELDIEKCIEELEEYNNDIEGICFRPVQYVEKLEKIDMFKKEFKHPDVPFLYMNNVKRKEWEYEEEWRLTIFKNSQMKTSYSFLNPKLPDIDGLERRFYYNHRNIKKIVLGNHFFNGSICSLIEDGIIELKYNKKSEKNKIDSVKFINFLYENFNDRLYMSGILESEKVLERYSEPIVFEKIKHNKFKIIRKSMFNP